MCKNYKNHNRSFVNGDTMSQEQDLTQRIMELLKNDPGRTVKELAEKLEVNRTFLAGYLKALENQKVVKSKRIGPAKVYFKERSGRE
jgi:predicted transcriptional regulator